MMTNQALIDALRERATKLAQAVSADELLTLAKVAELCAQAEDRVSAEHRKPIMERARQDADASRKFGTADLPPQVDRV